MRKDEAAVRGQKIRTESGPDRSSHSLNMNESIMGRKMGGGPNDMSHSLGEGGGSSNHNNDPVGSRKGIS